MRDILFRGKCIDYGWWERGDLYHRNDEVLINNFQQGFNLAVNPETVGQFTGLTENGKKIFEGDIGRYKQTDGAKRNGKPIICIGKVVYNAKTASFAVESKDEAGSKYFDYFPIKDFEVIGNIHDNPELLEE